MLSDEREGQWRTAADLVRRRFIARRPAKEEKNQIVSCGHKMCTSTAGRQAGAYMQQYMQQAYMQQYMQQAYMQQYMQQAYMQQAQDAHVQQNEHGKFAKRFWRMGQLTVS